MTETRVINDSTRGTLTPAIGRQGQGATAIGSGAGIYVTAVGEGIQAKVIKISAGFIIRGSGVFAMEPPE